MYFEIYKNMKIYYNACDDVWFIEDEMFTFSSKYITIIKNYIDKL